jgi:predicted PurR-regulated permease PerM
MARPEAALRQSGAFTLLCCVAVIAALYLAKDILLPFALAILLTFLLAPFVTRLEQWKFPRLLAVLLVVAVSFSGLGVLSSVVAHELYDVADHLPDYKANIVNKVNAFRSGGGGIVKKVTDSLADVLEAPRPPAGSSLDQGLTAPPGADAGKKVVQPVLVEVVSRFSANQITRSILGPILSPLGTAAIVIVLVVFMLLKREDLRNRLIHLMGSRQLNVTTQALDDAGSRLSRYLVMQLLINTAYGLVIAVGLYFIGLPNPLLWGVLTALLRFVPYVGPWIAAVIPIALSLAIFDGWTRPLLVVGLFVLNELVSNNVLEPWLYGASTGISSIGILVSAAFWTWLWGPVGLVMATPLTVCLTTLGRYVPPLAFLNTLLSDQEALSPAERFYQRLLALDPEEAVEVAEDYLEEHSLQALYDTVLLPALSLAEEDRHHGDLDDLKERLILDTLRELVDDLGARAKRDVAAEEASTDGLAAAAVVAPRDIAVLCLPARDEADEIAGMMLAQLLEARGVKAAVLSTRTLVGEMLTDVVEQGAGVVCVSALPPLAARHASYLCKRLRPKFPKLAIVVGLWQMGGGTKKAEERLAATGIDKFVTTLAEATEQLAQLASSHKLNLANTGSPEAQAAPSASQMA